MEGVINVDGSILTDIKKLFGIVEECEDFDLDLMLHINTSFSILNQLGVGPDDPFIVESKKDTWYDFLGTELSSFQDVKIYIYYKTKLGFDPTTSATMSSQLNDSIKELEWRMKTKAEMLRSEGDDL